MNLDLVRRLTVIKHLFLLAPILPQHKGGHQIILKCYIHRTIREMSRFTPHHWQGKKQAFANIKSRIQAKLNGWKGNLLLQAGKEILIKFVAQAILYML